MARGGVRKNVRSRASVLKRWARRISRLRQLSWSERRLLAEATIVLGAARFAVVTMPFRWISGLLGGERKETGLIAGSAADAVAAPIAKAVARVSGHTPWRSNCLAQALTAHFMLRRRRVPTTLYLGVASDADVRVHAHAWLRCGRHIVTGGHGHERFTVVVSYAWEVSSEANGTAGPRHPAC